MTSETCLLNIRGLVYYLEGGEWKPQGEGYSLISIYHETTRDMYRVVAISAKSREVIINSRILKEQSIKKENDNFFQWADSKARYGVNIHEKEKGAEFENKFKEVTEKLASQPAPAAAGTVRAQPNSLGGSAPTSSSPATTRPGPVGALAQRTPPPVSPRTGAAPGSPGPGARPAPVGRGTAPPPTGGAPPAGGATTTVQAGVAPGGRGAPPQVKPFSRPLPPKTPSRTNLLSSGGASSEQLGADQPIEPTTPTGEGRTGPPRLPSFRSTTLPESEPIPATPPSPSSRYSTQITPEQAPNLSPRSNATLGRTTPSPLASPSTATQATRGTPIKPSTGTIGPSNSRRIPSVTLGHATVSYNLANAGSSRGSVTATFDGTDEKSPRDFHSDEYESRDRSMTDSYFMFQNSDRRNPVLKRPVEQDISQLNAASAQLIRVLMQEHANLFDKQTSHVPSDIMALITFLDIYGLGVQDILAYHVLSKHLMTPLFKQLRTTKGAALSPDTDPHLAAEMLKTAIAELPHPPVNFEKYEPKQAFTELKDPKAQIDYVRGVISSLTPADKETVGALVTLLNKACNNSSTNGLSAERLAAIFAPFLVDTKWLDYKQATSVKLSKPFQL